MVRKIAGWVLELVGLALVAGALWTWLPVVGVIFAGLALLALGYTLYGDDNRK